MTRGPENTKGQENSLNSHDYFNRSFLIHIQLTVKGRKKKNGTSDERREFGMKGDSTMKEENRRRE